MKRKDIFVVGLMLFAMFFGAGNLIFPPALAYEAGNHYVVAMIGFMITGIGLPLLTIIVGNMTTDGYTNLLNQVHPWFSIIFLASIYLSLGPFVSIPRTATTSYELGIVPFLDHPGKFSLIIFSLIFFIIVLYLSLSPDNLVNSIGKILTPALLLAIVLLVAKSFTSYINNPSPEMSQRFVESPALSIGFVEGYMTMDAIAAMLFTIIANNTIRNYGVTKPKNILKNALKSCLIASGLLAVVYFSIAWVGNKSNIAIAPNAQNLGTYLLVAISRDGFGTLGVVILGVIVLLACITSATGLVTSAASYFHTILPKISYRAWTIIFLIMSLSISNFGLDSIIQYSQPILSILYPIAMTSVISLCILYFLPGPKFSIQLAIILVSIDSILATVDRLGIINLPFMHYLPLFEMQMEWLPFMIIGFIIGYLVGNRNKQIQFVSN